MCIPPSHYLDFLLKDYETVAVFGVWCSESNQSTARSLAVHFRRRWALSSCITMTMPSRFLILIFIQGTG